MIASFTPRPGLSRLALVGLAALGGVAEVFVIDSQSTDKALM